MGPLRAVAAEVYASHCQFYVAATGVERCTDLVWDGAGSERHLGVAQGVVAVGTIGYTFLPVAIEVWEAEPPLELESWDHVVEADLDVPYGAIELHGVEGPAEHVPLAVEPGTYRVRSSAAGLNGADEMDGGDRYRIQVWPSPPAAPAVQKWWPPWDPAGVEPRPTTGKGRLVVGAEAEDLRRRMRWLASRGQAHLFRDDAGTLWEHSNLLDASGTPQLEQLTEDEAKGRYGDAEEWAAPLPGRPSLGVMLQNLLQSLRYRRGWRPP
jgi:hypothetical protein